MMELQLWINSKTQIVMKLKKSNCDKTKTQIVKKTQSLGLWLLWQNSYCNKTPIVRKTQTVKKKLKNSNVTNFKFGQKMKTKILTKLKIEIVTKLKKLKLETWNMTNLNL